MNPILKQSLFLKGDTKEVLQDLKRRMQEASEAIEFEKRWNIAI